ALASPPCVPAPARLRRRRSRAGAAGSPHSLVSGPPPGGDLIGIRRNRACSAGRASGQQVEQEKPPRAGELGPRELERKGREQLREDVALELVGVAGGRQA